MNSNDENSKVNRRAFLRGVGVSAAAVPAAALLAPAVAATPATDTEASDTTGYHETDHVRQAYDTARF